MYVLRCTLSDLSRFRFGYSPLWETMCAIRLTADQTARERHLPWSRRTQQKLNSLRLSPVLELSPRHGYTPDFLAPPPLPNGSTFADEVAGMRATPSNQVRAELERSLSGRKTSARSWLSCDPNDVRDSLADLLTTAHEVLIAPYWHRMAATLDRDVAFHSELLGKSGLEGLFGSLNTNVAYCGGTISVRSVETRTVRLEGSGVILMPTIFGSPHVSVIADPPWQPTIIYPARGVGAVWHAPGIPTIDTLRRLLGSGRAEVLLAVVARVPTTEAISETIALSPSTVSEHLGVLYLSGLITKRRRAHTVHYTPTHLGAALVRGPTN